VTTETTPPSRHAALMAWFEQAEKVIRSSLGHKDTEGEAAS
jgi:hypothetical protein